MLLGVTAYGCCTVMVLRFMAQEQEKLEFLNTWMCTEGRLGKAEPNCSTVGYWRILRDFSWVVGTVNVDNSVLIHASLR